MTRELRRILLTVLLAGLGLGCQSITSPFDTIASSELRSQLSISPPEVAPGSAVTLRVQTTNSGGSLVSARNGCAPGLGFRIRTPDGEVIDPYAGVAFICPRLDSQDLEPGETDVVIWEWTPSMSGRHEVIGGLIIDGQVVGPSSPRAFQVR